MGILKNGSNFVVFLNFFVFIFTILTSETFGVVNIQFAIGSIHINRDISLTSIVISIVIIILIGALTGINILGSGINDSGTRAIIKMISLLALYTIMSLFTLTFFAPLGPIGVILFGIMSIIYALGYLEKESEGGL